MIVFVYTMTKLNGDIVILMVNKDQGNFKLSLKYIRIPMSTILAWIKSNALK